MTGKEFIRRVRRLARKCGLVVRLDQSAGRGDHMKLYFGNRTFHGVCKQLGIDPKEL
ncbi:MAG: hypothetical protein ACREJ0_03550 [Geminicoccaceae bacterium]